MGKPLRKLVLLLVSFLLTACGRAEIGLVQYAQDQCRAVSIVDEKTGWRLRGVEDMALDAATGRIFLSAYDRRAVEAAARRGKPALPNGGVYDIAVDALFAADEKPLVAASLLAPSDLAGGLRPHGLDYDASAQELVFINRTYVRNSGKWRMQPTLQRLGANGEVFVGASERASCAANDVLVTNENVLTSFDHGACNWRRTFEDVFGLKRSGIEKDGDALFSNAGFANGLARGPDGALYLAATRERALLVFNEKDDALIEQRRINVPGAPDNLTIALDGAVIAALHPSLIRLAKNRKLGIGRAPSRIVSIGKGDQTRILFDDPKGELFSAATVAVETAQGLVIGSVTDRGVLVCQSQDVQ